MKDKNKGNEGTEGWNEGILQFPGYAFDNWIVWNFHFIYAAWQLVKFIVEAPSWRLFKRLEVLSNSREANPASLTGYNSAVILALK
jgi:hypothetical protein